ncbi:aluminum-activated malate transporter 9-like [Populus alba x Populus x berolinensis]|nr:aluminum-activated malate transporter 9-like [Populus alba x Populus x berolinensis]
MMVLLHSEFSVEGRSRKINKVMKMAPFRHNYVESGKEWQPLLGGLSGDVEQAGKCKYLNLLSEKISKSLNDFQDFAVRAWEMGRSDPKKVIFAIKMGLALSIVSLLIFWKGSNEDISQYSIWAILTVIVMFEYSIGATFIKGFNRVLGTICAGILAFFCAELSMLAGGQGEEVLIVASIFIAGFFSSYLKLYPTMAPYEYGFRVFILTYCILMVAGNRTREYTTAVLTRLVLIAVGAGVCFVVNLFIYPIWAGDALHSLVAKNFMDLAVSLEGCVNGYLKCVEYERVPSKILTFQAYDDPLYNGYRSVLESTRREDSLFGFAIWEPPHGRFRMFNYPWKNYVKLSGALRHSAFMVMALHGCILSEIQAPAERRQVFRSELQRVGAEGANVLRELGSKVDKMEKLSPGDILKEVHEAAEQLQKKIDQRSYLLVNSESWEIARDPQVFQELENLKENGNIKLGFKSASEAVLDLRSLTLSTPSLPPKDSQDNLFAKQASWPSRPSFNADTGIEESERRTYESASALSLAMFASLLIEFSARLQNVVESFEELSEKANFAEPIMNSAIV